MLLCLVPACHFQIGQRHQMAYVVHFHVPPLTVTTPARTAEQNDIARSIFLCVSSVKPYCDELAICIAASKILNAVKLSDWSESSSSLMDRLPPNFLVWLDMKPIFVFLIIALSPASRKSRPQPNDSDMLASIESICRLFITGPGHQFLNTKLHRVGCLYETIF